LVTGCGGPDFAGVCGDETSNSSDTIAQVDVSQPVDGMAVDVGADLADSGSSDFETPPDDVATPDTVSDGGMPSDTGVPDCASSDWCIAMF
jgi:hypothetical protein